MTGSAAPKSAGWFPVGELGQLYIPDDQTGSCIPGAVAFVALVIRPRLSGAFGDNEPIFNMVCCCLPVETDVRLPSPLI
jgi:hypothetical protein